MTNSPIKIYRKSRRMSLEDFGALLSPPVDKSTVYRWQRKVPAERVIDIEKASGIPRHQLRPDLFEWAAK